MKKRFWLIIGIGLICLMAFGLSTLGEIIVDAPEPLRPAPRDLNIISTYIVSIQDANDTICFKIVGYEHAHPCMNVLDVPTQRDVEERLRAWKINQDAVDIINWEAVNVPHTPTPLEEARTARGIEIDATNRGRVIPTGATEVG